MRNAFRLFVVAAALVLLAAACGDDDNSDQATSSGDNGSTTTTTAAASGGAQVKTADAGLGTILVDADGKTLYRFDNDSGSTSSCEDACASTWPALTTEGDPTAGDGVDAGLLGTTDRSDGSKQVTYDGHPLYTYAADSAAGDTKGQGVGGIWWVVGADGQEIKDAGGAGSTTTTAGARGVPGY
jgi:predicted lipoprotein with Yx(FWY)xxD motif